MRRSVPFLPFAVALVLTSWLFVCFFMSVNVTPSMPRGIYLRLPSIGPVSVGDLVEFQNPEPDGYMGMELHGVPLMKRVVAVSADGTKLIVRGDTPLSYDSRFFGPLDASAVQAELHPILTDSGPVGDHIVSILLDKEKEE